MYITNNPIDFTLLHGIEWIYRNVPELVRRLYKAWPFMTKARANSLLKENYQMLVRHMVKNGPIHVVDQPYINVREVWRDANGQICFTQERFNLEDFNGEALIQVRGGAIGKIPDVASFKFLSDRLSNQILKRLLEPGVRV